MNRAYLFAYGFGGRKVLWGEGTSDGRAVVVTAMSGK
jgi:hypothetical protein